MPRVTYAAGVLTVRVRITHTRLFAPVGIESIPFWLGSSMCIAQISNSRDYNRCELFFFIYRTAHILFYACEYVRAGVSCETARVENGCRRRLTTFPCQKLTRRPRQLRTSVAISPPPPPSLLTRDWHEQQNTVSTF